MSIGSRGRGLRFPFPDDWKLSRQIIDDAERALLLRVKVSREFDVPYLAGYSRDGKTVYIDRSMPTSFVHAGRTFKTDKYLVLHECVEKALIDQLRLRYELAHQIAERAEESAVAADGVPLDAYDRFMNEWIKVIGARDFYARCPTDLDMSPYHDEDDQKTIEKMKFQRAA